MNAICQLINCCWEMEGKEMEKQEGGDGKRY